MPVSSCLRSKPSSLHTLSLSYIVVFDLMSSDQNRISFSNLKIIIQDLLQLPHNVGETKVFSVDAAADTAKSCWNYNGKQVLEYVTRDEFWMWVKREPVSLVWFPTLYRIATSETGLWFHHNIIVE
jgi:hypothetical protein